MADNDKESFFRYYQNSIDSDEDSMRFPGIRIEQHQVPRWDSGEHFMFDGVDVGFSDKTDAAYSEPTMRSRCYRKPGESLCCATPVR